ncbi:MAG TPA: hypothetical protein VGM67_15800 [Gemmatimonadaceae bacterium]
MTRRLAVARTALVCAAASLAIAVAPVARASAQSLPTRLDDSTFWRLIGDISEPGGYFRSNNFVGNETTLQWVIPELQRTVQPGGAYLGVGPDQNFTYLIALKPKIAFIVDIRRQNMLTLLMYKALIEQSSDRADFVSRLFSRQRPAGLDSSSSPEAIFAAFARVPADSVGYYRNIAALKDRLTRQHGFKLTDSDLAAITVVYNAFVDAGPDINYNYTPNGGTGYGRGRMPSYAEMSSGTDSVGLHRGYLGTEANFRTLKEMEVDNLIVPVVGDFAGPKALRAIGSYLKDHHAVVTTFYLSNVEQYLFQQNDDWSKFYTNASTLPIDSTSTFIRSVFGGMGYYGGGGGGFMRGQQLLASMMTQLKLFADGHLTSYGAVIQSSH